MPYPQRSGLVLAGRYACPLLRIPASAVSHWTLCQASSLVLANMTFLFADIRTWFANVEQHATEGVNKILIGNKCDWEEKRAVSKEQGQALADELGIPFLEVSAKANINIEEAFFSLANDIKKRIIDTSSKEASGGSSGVNVADNSGSGSGGKCC